MESVHKIKASLLEVCSLIEQARAAGYIVNFNLQTDNATGKTALTQFQVLQEVKVES